jgi:radical SAM superfamily enzyme YgiQ (UPF0313 family)
VLVVIFYHVWNEFMAIDIVHPRYGKVALVIPPLDSLESRAVLTNPWVPLNLLALGSTAFARGFQGEIRIIDGTLPATNRDSSPVERVLAELREYAPDLVGISPMMASYRSTLEIAEKLSPVSKVFLGGRWATLLAETIIKNRPFIDGVVRFDGEDAFAAILAGANPEDTPNLVFRNAGKIVTSGRLSINPRATVVPIDYSLVDLESYFDAHQGKRDVAIVATRGCPYRDARTGAKRLWSSAGSDISGWQANARSISGCGFCSGDFPIRYDDPQETWKQVMRLKADHGITGLKETGENPTGIFRWLKGIHDTKPEDAPGFSFIGSRVEHVTSATATMLANLKTELVFFGVESGDPEVLANANKCSSPEKYPDAAVESVRLLKERGVGVMVGLVLGMKGENDQSLDRTIALVERLLKVDPSIRVLANGLNVTPGSQFFNDLMRDDPDSRRKWGSEDILPIAEVNDVYGTRYTRVFPKRLNQCRDKLRSLSPNVWVL